MGTWLTTEDIQKSTPSRECILICGKEGSGKSTDAVSLAHWMQMMSPSATFFLIDTENGLMDIIKAFKEDAPTNIKYRQVTSMVEAVAALDDAEEIIKPGDWVVVESMSVLWDMAQDYGYMAISNSTRSEYYKNRPKNSKNVVPDVENFWNVVKEMHDQRFLDRLVQYTNINVLMTALTKKGSTFRENPERTAFKREFNTDVVLEGLPKLPSKPNTLLLVDRAMNRTQCTVLKDRKVVGTDTVKVFDIPGAKDFGQQFWLECRL